MQVYLIRHGATAGNLQKRYIGSTDEPLTQEAKRNLAEKAFPLPEILVVSPLRRCRETAEILFPGHPFFVEPALRETDFGEFEGKNYRDLSKDPRYQAWIDSGGTIAFPKGESPMQARARWTDGFLRYCREYEPQAKSIGFVVHGGTIMGILDAFSQPHEDFYHWQVDNGSGYRACWDGFEKLTKIKKIG